MSKLTQEEYKIVESVIEQMPGIVLLKDMNLTYLIGNQFAAKEAAVDHTDELIGLTDYNVKREEIACYADLFRVQDKKVLATGKPLTSLDVVPYYTGKLVGLMHTKSIFKGSDGNELGVMLNAIAMPDAMLKKVCIHLSDHTTSLAPANHDTSSNPANYIFSEHYEGLSLTQQQTECLFYLLRGMSCKAIAEILNLSQRIVERCIAAIKDDMCCNSQQEIIEKSVSRGYVGMIPKSIFNSMFNVLR